MVAHDASPSRPHDVRWLVPRCLLKLRDRANTHPELDGEGIQLWLDYELEALRFGIDPNVSRKELEALVEGSTMALDHSCYVESG